MNIGNQSNVSRDRQSCKFFDDILNQIVQTARLAVQFFALEIQVISGKPSSKITSPPGQSGAEEFACLMALLQSFDWLRQWQLKVNSLTP